MDRVGAVFFGRSYDFAGIEVALNMASRVRGRNMKRMFVRIGKYGNGFDFHLAQGVADADRDFTTIGDENFADHLPFGRSVLSVFSVFSIQGGFWCSRKAFMPACPSWLDLTRAIASAV